MRDRVRFVLDGTLILRQPTNGNLERPWLLKLEQDLAATIRSQRLPECFFEPVERVHMLHRGGERSISYEVSELRVKSPADVQKEQSISSV
jgi:hypothetical protein